MTTDDKIELLFFDPNKTRDDYINRYKRVCSERFTSEKERYRYSPLFLLLKDIRYCYGVGREFNSVRNNLHFPEFAAIILIRVAFTNTVKKFYGSRFDKFAKEFMGIEEKDQLNGLRLLRNALEHSFYSLYVYEHGIKYYFTLDPSYNHIIRKDVNWKRSYQSEMYIINPRSLFKSFEEGVSKFKKVLLDHSQNTLRQNFDSNFDIDQWIVTGP